MTVASGPLTQQRKEILVADESAQRVQGQRTALVDTVVEHVARTGIGQQQILRRVDEPAVVLPRQFVGARPTTLLRPQPFGVAGKTFVQPDVAPAPYGDAVAEPLVRQFVCDQAFRTPCAVTVVGPEDRKTLSLKGYFELVVGHHDGVTR